MVRMVDDLFELSRIHAGVAHRLAADRRARRRGQRGASPGATRSPAPACRLGGHVDPDAIVTADPGGLSRVVANLVINAIRHTPADGVVEVHRPARRRRVELSVTDGCGVSSDRTWSGSSTWPGRVTDPGPRARRPGRRPGAGHRQGHRRGPPRDGGGGQPRPWLPVHDPAPGIAAAGEGRPVLVHFQGEGQGAGRSSAQGSRSPAAASINAGASGLTTSQITLAPSDAAWLPRVPEGLVILPNGELVIAGARDVLGRYQQLMFELESRLDPDTGVARLALPRLDGYLIGAADPA